MTESVVERQSLPFLNGKGPAAFCIIMQSMTIPLAVRPVSPAFPGRLLAPFFVRLQGKRLEDAGFKIEDKVKVLEKPEKLVIRVVKDIQNPSTFI